MSPGMQWLDPLVTLAMCAAVTDRVRLGTSVLVLPYRNPVNLAAEAAALDVLTEGRFVLGVGARLDEGGVHARSGSTRRSAGRAPTSTSRCCARCGPRTRRASRAASATSTASCSPPPPRTEGGPPIWVGGNTDPALRRALRLGDGWHGFEVYPEDMPDVNERLARIGDEVGRDPGELDLSVVRGLIPPGREEESFVPDRRMLGGSAQAIVDELGAYAEHGVHDVVIQVSLLAPLVPEALEWVAAEVLPQLPR